MQHNRVALVDAQQKYTRAKELSAKQLLPQADLDAAKVAVDSAESALQSSLAALSSSQASVVQSQASLSQAQVNLDHCTIEAPIDGIVIQRSVDVGQTVAASMQAPTLFIIAADLAKMQVNANIDEADVGRIRPNQNVTFRVDAYPGEEFQGAVAQIRLQPVVVQNVTTYATIINVPEPRAEAEAGDDGEPARPDRAARGCRCGCRTLPCASGRATRCLRRSTSPSLPTFRAVAVVATRGDKAAAR